VRINYGSVRMAGDSLNICELPCDHCEVASGKPMSWEDSVECRIGTSGLILSEMNDAYLY